MNGVGRLLETSKLTAAEPEPLPDGTPVIYLHAGQLHASAEPVEITTILGSCVALCLWDPFARVGGINHFMLPYDGGALSDTPRYARYAIDELARRVTSLGAHLVRTQARLYGGACVLSPRRSATADLGARNVDVAREWLERQHIPIVAEDVGGRTGRRLTFRTDTGCAIVRRITS